MGGRHFGDVDALNAAVLAQLPGVASVVIKGSRFMKMERVVQAITAQDDQQRNLIADGSPLGAKAPSGGSAAASAANVEANSHAA